MSNHPVLRAFDLLQWSLIAALLILLLVFIPMTANSRAAEVLTQTDCSNTCLSGAQDCPAGRPACQ